MPERMVSDMFRAINKDSGEIWEWDSIPDRFAHFVKQLISDARWYREWFPENCGKCTSIVFEFDGNVTGGINVFDDHVTYIHFWEDSTDISICYLPKHGKEDN